MNIKNISYLEQSLRYSVGGNLETNRFDEYWSSYNWDENILGAFINMNHEFSTPGKLKAFEAYVTRLNGSEGCFEFMVSMNTISSCVIYISL